MVPTSCGCGSGTIRRIRTRRQRHQRNVIRMAQRVHAAGMLVHLDVMHSDWRAGPGPQRVLRVWSGCPDCACTEGKNCRCAAGKGCRTELDVDKLAQHAYEFTASVISQVTTACSGYPPHIVQACNEITNGMLWAPPRGKLLARRRNLSPRQRLRLPDPMRSHERDELHKGSAAALPLHVRHVRCI